MLNKLLRTVTASAECVRCHGGEIPQERTCLLCGGAERVTVTVSVETDCPHVLNDACTDAMYEMEIAKGLRAPDVSDATANAMNAEMTRLRSFVAGAESGRVRGVTVRMFDEAEQRITELMAEIEAVRS